MRITLTSLIRLPLEKLQEIEHEGKEAKYLSVIDKNVNYLLGITNQLLDFQKMENGALQLNLVSCDIKEIVNDVYSQFTSPAELKGIELVLTLPEQELRLSKIKMKLAKFHVLLSTRMCPLVIHPFQSSLLPLRLGNYLYHHAHIRSRYLHL